MLDFSDAMLPKCEGCNKQSNWDRGGGRASRARRAITLQLLLLGLFLGLQMACKCKINGEPQTLTFVYLYCPDVLALPL